MVALLLVEVWKARVKSAQESNTQILSPSAFIQGSNSNLTLAVHCSAKKATD